MSTGDLIQNAVGIGTIIAFVVAVAGWVFRRLNKSRQREIDDRIEAANTRREKEQEQGTPVERELRARIGELKQDLLNQSIEHQQEISEMRAEHNREIADLRRQFTSELDTLRGQLTEAYRTRPNAGGN